MQFEPWFERGQVFALWEDPVRNYLIYAVASVALSTSVQAADLTIGGFKDPLPDSLTWNGLTLYGTVDVGYAYQTHGAPLTLQAMPGLDYNIFGSKPANKPIWSFTDSAIAPSIIGVKIEEPIYPGWKAIGQVDTGFNPVALNLSNYCESLIENNGKPALSQTAGGDGPRCGPLNGNAYVGVSNATYGTLTVGRQWDLGVDYILRPYDPLPGAFAFSFVTYLASSVSGAGSIEASMWSNAIKYAVNVGPLHAAAMYTPGGENTPTQGSSYSFDVGGQWGAFSIDSVFTQLNNATVAVPYAPGNCGTAKTPSCDTLNATASDDTAVAVAAKYTFDFGGGAKDPAAPDRLTIFSGYSHILTSNPTSPVMPGTIALGGYVFGAVNNAAFASDKIGQTAWAGARYEIPGGWTFTGAYYHYSQDAYALSPAKGVIFAKCSGTKSPNCTGDANTVSGVVTYALTKHLDIYGGVTYSNLTGGLSNGYVVNNTTLVMTGMRFKI